MRAPSDHDLVQAYLDGTLAAEQVAAVENRLRSDARLANLVVTMARDEAIFAEWASAQAAGAEVRRNGFLRVARPQPSRQAPRRTGRWVAAGMLTAAVAAAVAFLYLGLPGRTPRPRNSDNLVAVNTQPEPSAPVYATLGDVQGDVYVVPEKGEPFIARSGQTLTLGQRLQTGVGGFAVLEFADSTRLDLNDNTTIQLLSTGLSPSADKALANLKVFLEEGTVTPVTPDAPPKQDSRPVVLATPHVAEARMPGSTRATITTNAKGTRIEQERGKMQVKRTNETQAVDVPSGFFAVAPANSGDPFASQPMPKPSTQARLVLKDGVGNVHQAAYSHDGNYLAAGCNDGTVKVWNMAAAGLPLPAIKIGGKGAVKAIAYSPDGALFAAAVGEEKAVKLFAVATGKELAALKGSKAAVACLAFSANGHLLAAAGARGSEIKVWNVHSHLEVATLPGNSNGVLSLAFAPDSRTLASAGRDHTIKLFDVGSRQLKQTLTGHSGPVNSVAFAPDGLTLASGGKDLTVRLWDPISGVERRAFSGMTAEVRAVAFSPDGRTLAAADHSVRLWDLASGQPLGAFTGHKNAIYSVAFSPKGKDIATAGWDKTIRVWDLSTLRPSGAP